MFCGKCGAQVPDGSAFCGSCGSPVGRSRQMQPEGQARQTQKTQQQNPYQSNQYQQDPYQQNRQQDAYRNASQYNDPNGYSGGRPAMARQQRSAARQQAASKNKFILIGVIAAAAVVVILLVVFLGGGGGKTATPEGTIKKFEKAMNDLNTKAMLECFDSETQQQYAGSGTDLDIKSYMGAFGAEFDVKLTPTDTDYYTDGGTEYCRVYLDMSYTVKALGQTQSEDTSDSIVLVKENGQWLITGDYYSSMIGSMF